MVSQQEKYETLECILKSKIFTKATTTKVLLKYIVECTIQNKEISATTIGLEIFGNRYNPEKNDVNIRVNISHLRKRLIQYYQDEGINDSIILSIEPGQYRVSFTKKSKAKPKRKRNVFILGFSVIAIIIAFIFFFSKSNEKVWQQTLRNGHETTLYLGDVFGYDGPTAFGNNGWHRDFSINSPKEFYERTNNNPAKYNAYKPGRFTFVNFENSYIIKPISQYLALYKYDFSIRPTSDFNIRAVKVENTIYAGAYFTQHAFIDLFNELAINIKLKLDGKLNVPDKLLHILNNKTYHLNAKSVNEELALVGVFNGPNNTRHKMFFSNHGIGLVALVEYFTNTDSLVAFSDKYIEESNEFIALYNVKGKDRTNISMELIFIDNNQ
ncbi:hypothetical protein [Labilibacter marinus]|uniref:hypothetical protein n=1 Tax=Labilibacter marinus TaxID=1477105 RepID=UPI00094F8B6E|nr:hypothetical protein [Labilibacter marinus]